MVKLLNREDLFVIMCGFLQRIEMFLVNDLMTGEPGPFINPSAICHTKGLDRDQEHRGDGQGL